MNRVLQRSVDRAHLLSIPSTALKWLIDTKASLVTSCVMRIVFALAVLATHQFTFALAEPGTLPTTAPGATPNARARLAQVAAEPAPGTWQSGHTRGPRSQKQGLGSASSLYLESPTSLTGSMSADGAWAQQFPGPCSGHTSVYDPVRDRMVVLCGWACWTVPLVGAPGWTQVFASGIPSQVSMGTATYDPARDRIVALGLRGPVGSEILEVWALSLSGAPSWIQLAPAGTLPIARTENTAIYDPVRDRIVVFGGLHSDGNTHTPLNDAWALSLSGTVAWTQLAPAGAPPSGRSDHTAIYDPPRDRMVVFGGADAGDDLWTLSLAETPTWTHLVPVGAPSGSSYGPAIYDPLRDRMVVLGHDGMLPCALSLAGTPSWEQLNPLGPSPQFRLDYSTIYDPVRDRMIVFAGYDGDCFYEDTWALSFSGTPAWTEMLPMPGGRYGQSAIYDPVRHRMVMFGGAAPYGNDVWSLTLPGAPAWMRMAPSGTPPPGRAFHSAVYDPVRDRMLVFGGDQGGETGGNDVWSLAFTDPLAWSQLAPTGTPPSARSEHAAIYDPVRDRMLVFGGCGPSPGGRSCYFTELWELSLGGTPAWRQLVPVGSPIPTYRPSAFYDPVRDRMVVAGHHDVAGVGPAQDVWVLSLDGTPTWTQLVPEGTAPNGRVYSTTIYDPVRDRLVLLGGRACGIQECWGFDDVWALSLGGTPAWTQLISSGGSPPSLIEPHPSAYDPVRDGILVFGYVPAGFRCDAIGLSQSWELFFGDVPTPTLVSLVGAEAFTDHVALTWQLGGTSSGSATVYRRDALSGWSALGAATPDGLDRITWTDRDVTPGARYGYRVGLTENGAETFAGETWVDVPAALTFALHGAGPNPGVGGLSASFTLPVSRPAMLELFDASGRRVTSREVGSLGAGRHVVDLAPARSLPSGVYLLRLTQDGRSLTSKAAYMR